MLTSLDQDVDLDDTSPMERNTHSCIALSSHLKPSFPKSTTLPRELRDEVWKLAIHGPRLVQF